MLFEYATLWTGTDYLEVELAYACKLLLNIHLIYKVVIL